MQIAQDNQDSQKSTDSDLTCTVLDSEPCVIPLSRGKFALIDWQDYERVSAHKWSIHASGPDRFYARCYVGKKHWFLHRFVLGMDSRYPLVDHRGPNKLDCRRSNLRIASHSQNSTNKYNPGRSGLKGVVQSAGEKLWRARIKKEGLEIYLGRFGTKEQAGRAYDAAAFLLHGEFAVLNFPEDFAGGAA